MQSLPDVCYSWQGKGSWTSLIPHTRFWTFRPHMYGSCWCYLVQEVQSRKSMWSYFMDNLTKWPEIFMVPDQSTTTIAHSLVEVVRRHGVPSFQSRLVLLVRTHEGSEKTAGLPWSVTHEYEGPPWISVSMGLSYIVLCWHHGISQHITWPGRSNRKQRMTVGVIWPGSMGEFFCSSPQRSWLVAHVKGS